MIEAIVGFIGLLIWAFKRYAEQQPERVRQQEQKDTDANLVKTDPGDLSLQLSELHEKASRRRAPGQPDPDAGRDLPQGRDVRDGSGKADDR